MEALSLNSLQKHLVIRACVTKTDKTSHIELLHTSSIIQLTTKNSIFKALF